MPAVLVAAAEGEHALYTNTLNTLGSTDNKHRGSVQLNYGDTMFRQLLSGEESNDMWFHILMARDDALDSGGTSLTFINIYGIGGEFLTGVRDGGSVSSNFEFVTRWATSAVSGDVSAGSFKYTFSNQEFVEFDFRVRVSTVTDANDTLTVDFYLNQQLRETRVVTDATGWPLPGRLLVQALQTRAYKDTCNYQDIIITDAVPTVGMELVTMVPAASGFYNQFANNYTNLDEPGYDSNDLIYSTAAGQRESWILTTPTFDTSDKIIYAFVANQVVQTDLGGVVSDFQPFVRINAIDYQGSSLGANNLAPNDYIHVFTQNPATLAPWVQADFDGLEVGLLTV